MPSSMLFAVNNEGRVFGLATNGTKWREFPYLGLDMKIISGIPHFLWAVGSDQQIYVHVHGLDIPIRVTEESYENQRWAPMNGFANRLLPTDRWPFSSEDGRIDRSKEKIRVPSMAWQWEGDWKVETVLNGNPLDHDGWTYAVDFPAAYSAQKKWNSCVRRRKWVRTRRYAAMNSWCAIAPLHKDPTREPFMDISIGGNLTEEARRGEFSLWAVTAHGRVMWRRGVTLSCPEGTRWEHIKCDIKGAEARRISCGPTGYVWVALWSGKALVRSGVSDQNPVGLSWEVVEPPETSAKITQISVGYHAVWAVTSDERVWFRKGVSSDPKGSVSLIMGTGWVEMVGNMRMVSVAPNDQVFAVGTDDRSLYYRVGVTRADLTGKRWRCLNASARISRASSLCSSKTDLHKSRRSTLSLQNTMGYVEECEFPGIASRSAPTSLKIEPDWRKPSQPSSLPASEGSVEDSSPIIINEELSQSERPQRKLTAWSPIRSVGSLLGCEANPFNDPTAEFDGIVHPERETLTECDPGWIQGGTLWTEVEAGALDLDPAHMPHWFLDANFTDGLEKTSWRNKMLSELQKINSTIAKKFDNYEMAVAMKSCTKVVDCRCSFSAGSDILEECSLLLEWVSNTNTVETASLTISSLDKNFVRSQLSMSEIVCIASSSEPGLPRISLYTRDTSKKSEPPMCITFMSENDHDEWMAYLSYVHAAISEIEAPPGDNCIWAITNLGDVYVFDHGPLQTRQYGTSLYSVNLDCSNAVGYETWEQPLSNGFPLSSILTVTGFIPKDCSRFAINLDGEYSKSNENINLHVNPRFDEECIVRNSKENDVWGQEEREGCFTLSRGGDFEIKIFCLAEGYKICVNGIVSSHFEHRLPSHGVTQIRVTGGVELHKVIYESKDVIVPLPEMVWKQVGGHLKKVETCAAGITWGLSSENVPYVYTGGWGGQFLNCLQKSVFGIHGMTDHCILDVYENQRWNPLSGFTSRGLPTDRPMWSDSTGLYKRSKETTRLLSKHWQWVSDWHIDFQAPGGVDNEGWQYAVDFSTSYHSVKSITDYVRRRRWIRTCKLTTSGPWLEVGNSKVIDISLQVSNTLDDVCIWAVSAKGDALYRKGVTKDNPLGDYWEHVACSEPLESISCGCCNQVWASTKDGASYWRFGISTSNPIGDIWEIVEPPKGALIKRVTVAQGAVWALDREGKLHIRREVSPVFPEGTHWQTIANDQGILHQIVSEISKSVHGGEANDRDIFRDVSASGDEVWAITSSGTLVRRLGVNCENPAGYAWSNAVSANWNYVSARSYSTKSLRKRR